VLLILVRSFVNREVALGPSQNYRYHFSLQYF
jgi:hypothetical protein